MTSDNGSRTTDNAPSILHAHKLTKDYDSFRALDSLDLDLSAGEIFGLLGPNGSGKTTALRLFLGFLKPTLGHAEIAGHDCWQHGVRARRETAYLPGELRLYENMTGRQLLRFLGQLRAALDPAETSRLARAFDIDLSRPIAHLSSGMKRKLALLLVLLPRTPLLILDEPTNTLDPTMRDELLGQLRQARERGQAVVFSSHVLSEVEQVCDRVGILQRGRLVHLQSMNELREVHFVRATLPRSIDSLPELPGTKLLEKQGNQWSLECNGSLAPLLSWLAAENAQSVWMEPLGLAPIYRRFHGAQA